jgi:hypothetical protein
MLLVLINTLILLVGIGIPIVALFWKHFALKPGESARAILATIAGMVGLAVFFLQSYIMSTELGQNVITVIQMWLGG